MSMWRQAGRLCPTRPAASGFTKIECYAFCTLIAGAAETCLHMPSPTSQRHASTVVCKFLQAHDSATSKTVPGWSPGGLEKSRIWETSPGNTGTSCRVMNQA
eukprot:s4475_g5.t1